MLLLLMITLERGGLSSTVLLGTQRILLLLFPLLVRPWLGQFFPFTQIGHFFHSLQLGPLARSLV